MNLKPSEHVVVAGGSMLNCMWPRYGGLWRWGREVLAAFVESPCTYRHPPESARDVSGIWKRGYIRLRRSRDGGQTWADDGKVFDHSISYERQRHVLQLDTYRGHTPLERESIASEAPDTVLLMGRAWCGEEIAGRRQRGSVAYCVRSADRGRSWEDVPGVIQPCPTKTLIPHANNILNLGGGTLVAAITGSDGSEGTDDPVSYYGPLLYRSEDHGTTWHFFSEICRDPHRHIAYSFARILALPSGRWLCFANAWAATGGAWLPWTVLSFSDDQGLNWSGPRTIGGWSTAPYPLRLDDGRLLVFFMRCAPDPVGLFVIGSDDDGAHWSEPVCLRRSELLSGVRAGFEMGFPVAAAVDDHRVLVLYDWQNSDDDVPWYGGRSFIAGTFVETP